MYFRAIIVLSLNKHFSLLLKSRALPAENLTLEH